MMLVLFWISFAAVFYAYIGYAAVLWLHSRLWLRPVACVQLQSRVSIVIAARNEEKNLCAKFDGLRALHYPQHLLQVVVVSDGSTDGTVDLLGRESPWVTPVLLPKSKGKAAALNEAVQHATGDVLVFLDARQAVDPNAVSELVSCFTDPSVGAVSGELLLESGTDGDGPRALGLYWKIEKAIRKLESDTGSVVGVTGAIYAIRRELYTEMPAGTILDDVFIPMCIARKGMRVVFHPRAIARDLIFADQGKEFARKVRTLSGNYQLLRIAPWMLSPANPLLFRFISHKLMRLVVPFALAGMLATSALASGLLLRVAFWLQAIFYAIALAGAAVRPLRGVKIVAVAHTFVMLNAAAVIAFANFITGRFDIWT